MVHCANDFFSWFGHYTTYAVAGLCGTISMIIGLIYWANFVKCLNLYPWYSSIEVITPEHVLLELQYT